MGKKIMFIDENKIVNYSGGIERVICAMANEFIHRGYNVSIVCMDTENGVPFFALNRAINFINLAFEFGNGNFDDYKWFFKKVEKEALRAVAGSKMRLFGRKFEDPKKKYFYDEFISRLQNCIKETKPDIIIPIGPDSAWIAWEAQEKSGMKQVPVLPMNHIDPPRVVFPENNIIALRKCNVTQALLPIYVDTFRQLGVERVEVIPNIVPQFKDDELVDLSKCKNRIIHVGRVDGDQKRQHLLIEAFALIADRHPSWKVSLYGYISNKRYKGRLDRIIKKNKLEGRVIFEGVSENIYDEYKKSDIFVFPSGYEGFGLAITEAMSIGLPVLAYRSCKTLAAIVKDKETGILCDDGIESLANKLSLLIENSELRCELGRKAHNDMKQYSADIVWHKWENLISELVENN